MAEPPKPKVVPIAGSKHVMVYDSPGGVGRVVPASEAPTVASDENAQLIHTVSPQPPPLLVLRMDTATASKASGPDPSVAKAALRVYGYEATGGNSPNPSSDAVRDATHGMEPDTSLRDTIRAAADASEQTQGHPARPMPSPAPADPHHGAGSTTLANLMVLAFCELWGLVLGFPPGEDLYHGAPVTVRMVAFMVVASVFAIGGPVVTFVPWDRLVGVSSAIRPVATNPVAWFVSLAMLLLVSYGPDLYQRATAPYQSGPTAQDVAAAIAPLIKPSATPQEIATEIVRMMPQQKGAAVPSAEEIAASVVRALPSLRSAVSSQDYDSLQKQLESLRQENVRLKSGQPTEGPVTPMLGLSDAKRWKVVTAFRDTMAQSIPGNEACHALLASKPRSPSTDEFWKEFQPILYYSGWQLEGGPNRMLFTDGISINAASDKGAGFMCGWRLSELLQSLHVENVSFHANQTTPNLLRCPECTEVVLGDITIH